MLFSDHCDGIGAKPLALLGFTSNCWTFYTLSTQCFVNVCKAIYSNKILYVYATKHV